MEIDEINLAIINHLRDGRMPFKKIADSLAVSEGTVRGRVKKLKEEGVTILLVEQNIHHALEISDRAYVMEKGKIILEGKGTELLKDKYVKKAYLGA